jgi:hypothetical protein
MLPLEKNIPVKDKISPERHIKAAPFRKDTGKTEPHKHKQYFEIVFLPALLLGSFVFYHKPALQHERFPPFTPATGQPVCGLLLIDRNTKRHSAAHYFY